MKEVLRSTDSADEAVILGGALRGERAAFEALCALHYDRTYSLAYRLCGAQSDAEDIAQETFLRVARGIRGFRCQSKFSTWIYKITVNVFYDWRLKNKNEFSKIREYKAVSEDFSPAQAGGRAEDF